MGLLGLIEFEQIDTLLRNGSVTVREIELLIASHPDVGVTHVKKYAEDIDFDVIVEEMAERYESGTLPEGKLKLVEHILENHSNELSYDCLDIAQEMIPYYSELETRPTLISFDFDIPELNDFKYISLGDLVVLMDKDERYSDSIELIVANNDNMLMSFINTYYGLIDFDVLIECFSDLEDSDWTDTRIDLFKKIHTLYKDEYIDVGTKALARIMYLEYDER